MLGGILAFNWGVFWSVLAAILVGRIVAVAFPLSVTLTMADFREIMAKLGSIEGNVERMVPEDTETLP